MTLHDDQMSQTISLDPAVTPGTAPIERGEIWWLQFPPPVGKRPALILTPLPADSAANRLITRLFVAPLTTKLRQVRSDLDIVFVFRKQQSLIKLANIQVVDRNSLLGQAGKLEPWLLGFVDDALRSDWLPDHKPDGPPSLFETGDICSVKNQSLWKDGFGNEREPKALVLTRSDVAASQYFHAVPLRTRPPLRTQEIAIGEGLTVQLNRLRPISIHDVAIGDSSISGDAFKHVLSSVRQAVGIDQSRSGLSKAPDPL